MQAYSMHNRQQRVRQDNDCNVVVKVNAFDDEQKPRLGHTGQACVLMGEQKSLLCTLSLF